MVSIPNICAMSHDQYLQFFNGWSGTFDVANNHFSYAVYSLFIDASKGFAGSSVEDVQSVSAG